MADLNAANSLAGLDILPELEPAITLASLEFGINPNLIRAVIMRESSGGRKLVNPESNATGAMQVTPSTLDDYNKRGITTQLFGGPIELEDLENPEIGVLLGSKILSDRMDLFPGDLPKALASYGGFVKEDPTEYVDEIMTNAGLKEAEPALDQSAKVLGPPAPPAEKVEEGKGGLTSQKLSPELIGLLGEAVAKWEAKESEGGRGVISGDVYPEYTPAPSKSPTTGERGRGYIGPTISDLVRAVGPPTEEAGLEKGRGRITLSDIFPEFSEALDKSLFREQVGEIKPVGTGIEVEQKTPAEILGPPAPPTPEKAPGGGFDEFRNLLALGLSSFAAGVSPTPQQASIAQALSGQALKNLGLGQEEPEDTRVKATAGTVETSIFEWAARNYPEAAKRARTRLLAGGRFYDHLFMELPPEGRDQLGQLRSMLTTIPVLPSATGIDRDETFQFLTK